MKKFLILATGFLLSCVVAAPGAPREYDPIAPRRYFIDPTANACLTRGSSYVFHRMELSSGTCGPVADSTITIDMNGRAFSSSKGMGMCVTGPAAREDGCRVAMDSTCNQDGTTKSFKGWMLWEPDGSGGHGLSDVTMSANGVPICHSTYVVVSRRL